MSEDPIQVALLADYVDVLLRMKMVEALVSRAARSGGSLSREDWIRLEEATCRDSVVSRAKIQGRSPQRPNPPAVVERPATSEPPDQERAPLQAPPARKSQPSRRVPSYTPRLLSPQRIEIVQMLADGMSQGEIAAELGVSTGSVKYHIAASLDVSRQESAHGLVAWASRNGYLTEPAGMTPLARLSAREEETLALLAAGYTDTQIARATKVTQNTVKTRIARLRDKLGTRTRCGIVGAGWRCGLLSTEQAAA